MAIDNFSKVFSARYLRNYRRIPGIWRTLVHDVSDRLEYGANRIELPHITGAVTISDYTQDTAITATESIPGDANHDLTLDQKKFFRIYIDDLAEIFTRPSVLEEYAQHAAEKMSDTIDLYCRDQLFTGVDNAEKVSTGNLWSDVTALADATIKTHAQKVLDAVLLADGNNFPLNSRRCVISKELKYVLCKFLIQRGAAPADSLQGSGLQYISTLLGMPTAMDTSLPDGSTTGDEIMIISNPQSRYFAQSLRSVETYRPHDKFGTGVKGLAVYGSTRAYGTADKNVIIIQASA